MSCDLDTEELEVLNFLRKSKCLRANRGEEEKNFKKWYVHKSSKKGYVKDFKTVIKRLLNEGYIARVGGKAKRKYYISDMPRTFFALRVHGYKV